MREPLHPRRTTVLVGLGLALLLVVVQAVVSWTGPGRTPPIAPGSAAASPSVPVPTVPTVPSTPRDTPEQGPAYPVRRLGALSDRSVIANGRGDADLRYRRAPRNGTRLHFICTGCDDDTWLVEWPRGNPVGGGPLADPSDATSAVDTVELGRTTSLLVKAPARSRWSLTLTPFDAVPVHEQTFDALDDDVVAVRAAAPLELTCGGSMFLRTLARAGRAAEYDVLELRQDDDPGSWPVEAPSGTDLMIMMVSCPGRWTVTLP